MAENYDNQKERVFVKGCNVKLFKGRFGNITKVGIKLDEFIEFARANERNGWFNFDIKNKKDGEGVFAEVNDFIPNSVGGGGTPSNYNDRHSNSKPVGDVNKLPEVDINSGSPTDDLPF